MRTWPCCGRGAGRSQKRRPPGSDFDVSKTRIETQPLKNVCQEQLSIDFRQPFRSVSRHGDGLAERDVYRVGDQMEHHACLESPVLARRQNPSVVTNARNALIAQRVGSQLWKARLEALVEHLCAANGIHFGGRSAWADRGDLLILDVDDALGSIEVSAGGDAAEKLAEHARGKPH